MDHQPLLCASCFHIGYAISDLLSQTSTPEDPTSPHSTLNMAPSWLPLPSLLPSNLQKRLLSYALTHVLGTFLEPQTFSLENLELQLLNGSVTLRNLELNTAKVNSLLKLPGVEIIDGRVGEVVLQIPVRDVLSGKISVKIQGIEVFVRPCSEQDKSEEPVPDMTPDSLAQSFLQSSIHDPSDSVLLDTLSQSIPAPEELGLGPAEEQGMFTSILAGFVDALKARLAIEINDLNIHVQHPRSGAFILSLKTISFLPREDKLNEKILSMSGIEAFLQNEIEDDDDVSVASTSTVTSPSPTNTRSPRLGGNGLSESMMFSPQEAQSLYMSAYSQQAAQSTYMSTQLPEIQNLEVEDVEPPSQSESSASVDKGFRFFYFEKELIFHVVTTSSESESNNPESQGPPIQTAPPAFILQSAIPTAYLFLNPNVNLLPSISLISSILALSPTSSPSSSTPQTPGDPGSGIDFSWLGGMVIHFGSEGDETIARFADWNVTKRIGEEAISVSVGQVEILSAAGEKIVSLDDTGSLNLLILPNLLQVSLPEVNVRCDLGGLGSLQPLVKAMKQAWQESVAPSVEEPVDPEGGDDEDWDANLIVETIPRSPSQTRQLQLEIQRFVVTLSSDEGAILLSIDEINMRSTPSADYIFEFNGATVSIPSSAKPLLSVSKSGDTTPLVDFVFPLLSQPQGFLVNGAQEILDDFLAGETSRSDDAWGMIRSDASNNSKLFIKVRLPRVDVQVSGGKDIEAVKKVLSRIQKTVALFIEEPVEVEVDDDSIDSIIEFRLDDARFEIKLDETDSVQGRMAGIEGTVVKGIAGGDTVGVVDVAKMHLEVKSPSNPRKVLHESVHKGNDSTPSIGSKFVFSRDGQLISRLGLFNLNVEYFVFNPWLDKLSNIFTPTPQTDSTTKATMANAERIATLSPQLPPPTQLNVSLSDCTIGLNPLDLPSRGLLLITSTTIRGEWDYRDGGRGKFDVSLNKAHLFCIDDTANLVQALLPTRMRSGGRKEFFGYFSDLGYALCATMPTGNATVRLLLAEARAEIDVEDVSIQLDTCADSTQTLGDMFNCLKPPIEADVGRYRSASQDAVNLLSDIDENAFAGGFNTSKEPMPMDEDLVNDDVPFNLEFVESYYGDQSNKMKPSPSSSRSGHNLAEEQGDELLAEGNDIGHFAEPPKPALPVAKGTFGEFEEQIRVFGKPSASTGGPSGSVRFVEEHFPAYSVLQEDAFLSSDSILKLRLRNTRVVWNLHDGYDWPRTRDTIAIAVQKVEQKAAEALAAKARRKLPQPTRTVTLPEVLYGEDPYAFDEDEDDDFDDDSEIGDILFNSIYVGVRRGQDPHSLARNINRDLDAQSDATSQISTTPSSPIRSSRGASPGFGSNNALERTRRPARSLRLKRSRMQKVQINLRALGVDFDLLAEPEKPGQSVISNLRLKVGDLEILDNVPTSHWNKFVTYWRGGDKRKRETASAMVDLEVVNVKPVHSLTASELVVKARVLPLKLHVDQDTLDFITRFFEFKDQSAQPSNGIAPEPPFLQRVQIFPVNVMLDYKPKKVDYAGLRSGRTTEFMNFFTLEEAEILLKGITLYGISGYPKLFQKLNDFWMPDIRGTQLFDVLGGINYVRPFTNIGGGMKDLILVPMKEYRRDGRILQGTGKGMVTFGKTFANELVKVGARLAIGAQKGLEWGEGLIEGKQPSVSRREGLRFEDDDWDSESESDPRVVTLSPYADQPANIKQGIKRAIDSLIRNAKSASETVIAIPQEVAESGSAAGAGKTVLKAIPVAIIRPLIGASGAVSNTLMGIHNSLDSDQQRNIEDKYKR